MKVAWRRSWQWLKRLGSRKPPIGIWARSGGRYVRWRAAAIVMILDNLFHILMMHTDTEVYVHRAQYVFCTTARDYIILRSTLTQQYYETICMYMKHYSVVLYPSIGQHQHMSKLRSHPGYSLSQRRNSTLQTKIMPNVAHASKSHRHTPYAQFSSI